MAQQKGSGISWTDATWNPIVGCSKVSEGCRNCWAERQARLHYHDNFPNGWDSSVIEYGDRLTLPLHWKKPCRIAVALMGDLFHENVSDNLIAEVFAVMGLAPRHTFQVLTKRPARMKAFLSGKLWVADGFSEATALPYLPNVWLGVSCENQAAADERILPLLQTPAAVRFVSIEPMLGPIDLEKVPLPDAYLQMNGITGVAQPLTEKDSEPDDYRYFTRKGFKLDWVVCGGESGPGARPCHPDWVRAIRDQCQAAGVAFHFKQWGEWLPNDQMSKFEDEVVGLYGKRPFERFESGECAGAWRVGKEAAGRMLDGREWLEFPGAQA